MKLEAFKLQESSGIYVPPDSTQETMSSFAYRDGAEEYMLKTVMEAGNLTFDSEELEVRIKDWPTRYHLGQGRSNVLRALEVDRKAKVLELGAGCGALSRYLGERCEALDCVEGGYIRAQICRRRCDGLRNVRVFCSDILDISFEPVYDLVMLIGVLEYAPQYFKEPPQSACIRLLEIASSALNKNGILLIATENKIGLKYWTGCPEDHTGKLYDGIHGYPKRGGIVTFSKNELGSLLRKVGFESVHFYSCYPDYKFASTILSELGSDDELYLHNWIDVPFEPRGMEGVYNLHEGLVLRTLSKAGLLREFTNSFLVAASKAGTSPPLRPDWAAKKISGFPRRRAYRCITTLKASGEKLSVEKQGFDSGLKNAVFHTTQDYGLLRHCLTDSVWQQGDLMLFDAYEALLGKNVGDDLMVILRKYYETLMANFQTGERDVWGYPLLSGDCFDFILRNIVKRDGELFFIDKEWCVKNDVPADYILYRCIVIDVLRPKCPYTRALRRKPEKFIVPTIRTFFPQYNKKRFKQNKELETMLLNTVIVS